MRLPLPAKATAGLAAAACLLVSGAARAAQEYALCAMQDTRAKVMYVSLPGSYERGAAGRDLDDAFRAYLKANYRADPRDHKCLSDAKPDEPEKSLQQILRVNPHIYASYRVVRTNYLPPGWRRASGDAAEPAPSRATNAIIVDPDANRRAREHSERQAAEARRQHEAHAARARELERQSAAKAAEQAAEYERRQALARADVERRRAACAAAGIEPGRCPQPGSRQ